MAKRYTSYILGVFVLIAVTLALLQAEAAAAPAVYIFGDSTLDVGTNVFIPDCLARADVYFNGIDFPSSVPTGRFSNGLNTADEIGHKFTINTISSLWLQNHMHFHFLYVRILKVNCCANIYMSLI